MEWKRFTIYTTEDAEDSVCAMLDELGFGSVEIEDKKPVSPDESGGLFGDVVPEMPENDHLAAITFYTDSDADSEEVLTKVRGGLDELRAYVEIGEGRVEESSTKEEDWINNWKQFFHSFMIDDLLIEPSWESGRNLDEHPGMVVRIDPGTAFGTGAHESTQLAIRALRKYLREGDAFLDIGTGSGILGIVALKSGAGSVFGTDLDPNTLPAIEENLQRNGIDGKHFQRILGNIIDDPAVQEAAGEECYDIAAANIIAEILTEITPSAYRCLKKGGIYITSGILHEREEMVKEAAEKAGFRVLEINRMGEWSGIVFRK